MEEPFVVIRSIMQLPLNIAKDKNPFNEMRYQYVLAINVLSVQLKGRIKRSIFDL